MSIGRQLLVNFSLSLPYRKNADRILTAVLKDLRRDENFKRFDYEGEVVDHNLDLAFTVPALDLQQTIVDLNKINEFSIERCIFKKVEAVHGPQAVLIVGSIYDAERRRAVSWTFLRAPRGNSSRKPFTVREFVTVENIDLSKLCEVEMIPWIGTSSEMFNLFQTFLSEEASVTQE